MWKPQYVGVADRPWDKRQPGFEHQQPRGVPGPSLTAWALNEADLIGGGPAREVYVELGGRFGVVPAISLDTTSIEYVVYDDADRPLVQDQVGPTLGVLAMGGFPGGPAVQFTECTRRSYRRTRPRARCRRDRPARSTPATTASRAQSGRTGCSGPAATTRASRWDQLADAEQAQSPAQGAVGQ